MRAIYLGLTAREMARTCVYLVYCFKRSNTLLVTVYLTWMSTICVVVMATYGRTLCWEKRNTVPNTGGVFAVGAIQQTMDITDVKRLWGTPLGVVGAYPGPSGAPPVTPVAPNRCLCAVLLSTERGVLHLAREGLTARVRHDGGTYWK